MTYTTETPAEDSSTQSVLKTQTFQRKPFQVEAVQITEENFEMVADWCGGSIVTVQEPSVKQLLPGEPKRFIQVSVTRPLTKRQTEAYVGDWILFASKGYKVYANRPFLKNFEEIPQELFVTDAPVQEPVDES
ncbi:hypothetical protein SEA_AVAZAK_75 [Gordonia phage Avazak]|uniref:Uncharacterized protein n=1 Tax=Gordonia phage Avazak TaxID=2656529 RepID=A0A649V7V7_9CAUD|nr:hypothetical protein HWC78_gp75 [Gordonia phage Avazak]QGJ88052.1 hypothetical protein SEA_AVAZAK_75 [Gordonia phage Avazak]